MKKSYKNVTLLLALMSVTGVVKPAIEDGTSGPEMPHEGGFFGQSLDFPSMADIWLTLKPIGVRMGLCVEREGHELDSQNQPAPSELAAAVQGASSSSGSEPRSARTDISGGSFLRYGNAWKIRHKELCAIQNGSSNSGPGMMGAPIYVEESQASRQDVIAGSRVSLNSIYQKISHQSTLSQADDSDDENVLCTAAHAVVSDERESPVSQRWANLAGGLLNQQRASIKDSMSISPASASSVKTNSSDIEDVLLTNIYELTQQISGLEREKIQIAERTVESTADKKVQALEKIERELAQAKKELNEQKHALKKLQDAQRPSSPSSSSSGRPTVKAMTAQLEEPKSSPTSSSQGPSLGSAACAIVQANRVQYVFTESSKNGLTLDRINELLDEIQKITKNAKTIDQLKQDASYKKALEAEKRLLEMYNQRAFHEVEVKTLGALNDIEKELKNNMDLAQFGKEQDKIRASLNRWTSYIQKIEYIPNDLRNTLEKKAKLVEDLFNQVVEQFKADQEKLSAAEQKAASSSGSAAPSTAPFNQRPSATPYIQMPKAIVPNGSKATPQSAVGKAEQSSQTKDFRVASIRGALGKLQERLTKMDSSQFDAQQSDIRRTIIQCTDLIRTITDTDINELQNTLALVEGLFEQKALQAASDQATKEIKSSSDWTIKPIAEEIGTLIATLTELQGQLTQEINQAHNDRQNTLETLADTQTYFQGMNEQVSSEVKSLQKTHESVRQAIELAQTLKQINEHLLADSTEDYSSMQSKMRSAESILNSLPQDLQNKLMPVFGRVSLKWQDHAKKLEAERLARDLTELGTDGAVNEEVNTQAWIEAAQEIDKQNKSVPASTKEQNKMEIVQRAPHEDELFNLGAGDLGSYKSPKATEPVELESEQTSADSLPTKDPEVPTGPSYPQETSPLGKQQDAIQRDTEDIELSTPKRSSSAPNLHHTPSTTASSGSPASSSSDMASRASTPDPASGPKLKKHVRFGDTSTSGAVVPPLPSGTADASKGNGTMVESHDTSNRQMSQEEIGSINHPGQQTTSVAMFQDPYYMFGRTTSTGVADIQADHGGGFQDFMGNDFPQTTEGQPENISADSTPVEPAGTTEPVVAQSSWPRFTRVVQAVSDLCNWIFNTSSAPQPALTDPSHNRATVSAEEQSAHESMPEQSEQQDALNASRLSGLGTYCRAGLDAITGAARSLLQSWLSPSNTNPQEPVENARVAPAPTSTLASGPAAAHAPEVMPETPNGQARTQVPLQGGSKKQTQVAGPELSSRQAKTNTAGQSSGDWSAIFTFETFGTTVRQVLEKAIQKVTDYFINKPNQPQ